MGTVPANPFKIIQLAFKETVPKAHAELQKWHQEALKIEDVEIREQAAWTVNDKTFHCEGGSIFALLAGENKDNHIQFLVAYQTICDYLDTLCDKNDAHDPNDFRSIHQALLDCLTPDKPYGDYYQYRDRFEDNGYLRKLVDACREATASFPGFADMQTHMQEVSQFYIDFQVYKHVEEEKREPLLKDFYERNKHFAPTMRWYEFACGTASTLALYCMAAYAAAPVQTAQGQQIKEAYFPWVQGVHILLDYFIDQEEDRQENEMNFVAYYRDSKEMFERFKYIDEKATEKLQMLPDKKFHLLLKTGLYALYLSDKKVMSHPRLKAEAKQLIKLGGFPASLFYYNRWIFKRKIS
ncbi:tetraprenyl-beta-curcumene synthase family protein [Shouchella clausii]|uniref:tetraprenyl-beta-curcumene synthase family protein n=1 Tax=Shouchella clausii TaxID=79880 RepID=UPI000B9778FA|nr:tetraprenyl-beta-curcumene synthase family protein [Shouchella clausii]AST94481.1 tetraprenyl-beta-curcumene synthase [Shouchella clausii]AST98479.1 tetraprenyl-beta-curcumene synthase [Shouchella clausii]MCR1290293.1 tetraprenyl-beta-curcumene synthase family protein [Shouchella clausii]MEB5472990.1 tetraprenyl-beta-curcumene synthase family protein [Shouchella clausii]PAD91298.1 tetraprenyl-beta-curcumene synthase [Shouchella clausii]